MIRIPQVRVVDEEGAQLGVMPTPQALAMAQERGLDLVEVAPMAAPPVVKFLDFGQYKYELTKREKENKRRQRSVTFKEVRLSPKIGSGDFDTKVHRAIEFLEDGDRIKVTVRFRGRELTHPELGRNMLARFTDRIKEHGVAERAPLLEGKSMHLTVASLHKPKEHEAPARPPKGGEQAAAPAEERAPARTAAQAPAAAADEPKTVAPASAAEAAPAPAEATAQAQAPAERAPVAVGAAAKKTTTESGSTNAAPAAAARTSDPSGPQAPAATGE
jgi:translation initiation factor IF-3